MLETTDHQIAMVSGHLKNHHLSNQRGSFQNMFTRAQCMFMVCVKKKGENSLHDILAQVTNKPWSY